MEFFMKELMSKIKSILILIAILVAFSFVYQYLLRTDTAKIKAQLSRNEALVILDDGSAKRYFAGEVKDNMTVLDVIKASDEIGKFGAEIDDGRVLVNGKGDWLIYQNNYLLSQSLNKYVVKQGDTIMIKEK